MQGLVSLAYDLGLPACGEALARDRISRQPQRVRAAAAAAPLLGELCRFGPSPSRVRALLEHSSPAARAWIADDVLGRLLFTAADGALIDTLCRAELDAAAEAISLAPAEAISIAPALAPPGAELWRAVADAHLPRLACALLPADALADAAELLLDAELLDALPDPATLAGDGTPAELELAGYVAARIDLMDAPAAVAARLDENADVDYARAGADDVLRFARAHLVRAEAALHTGRVPVPFELLGYIADQRPRWRYAHRVRLAVAARQGLDATVEQLDRYLDQFGNDAPLWRTLLAACDRAAPLYDRLRLRLAAEVVASSRDAVPWDALVTTLEAPAAVAELRERRRSHGRVPS